MTAGRAAELLGVAVPSPVCRLVDDRVDRHGVRLLLKRDDLLSPLVPGNKWRKLKYNLVAAAEGGHRTLLTFGGAYSNHLRAVAAAGRACGFATVGVVRGEPHEPLNWSLARASELGMSLTYLDRTTWRRRHAPEVLGPLRRRYGDCYEIPEGGSNRRALRGCAELVAEIDVPFDVICCPVGTGGTLAGVSSALSAGQRAIGFAALKGGGFLADEVAALHDGNWEIETGYHFGGFARRNPELTTFVADFEDRHGIRLDWIYVGKMLAGLFDLIGAGRFAPGTTVVAVVTGPAEPPTRQPMTERYPQAN